MKDRPGFNYIRKPGEKSTYVAKLAIDLSTKFSDWVETDLLKLKPDEVTEVVIDHTSVDAARRRLVEGEKDLLTRVKSTDPWKLDGLDEKTEELENSKITTLLTTLDDLKLVGVRPKPKGLRADLTLDPKVIRNPNGLEMIVRDLLARGFFPDRDPTTKGANLYSNAGELIAATNKGVVYTLKFGEVFSGDESEIEIGADEDKKKAGEKDAAEGDKKKSKEAESKQPSRYVFVAAKFDETFLGAAPEKPSETADGEADAPKISPATKKDADQNDSVQKSR